MSIIALPRPPREAYTPADLALINLTAALVGHLQTAFLEATTIDALKRAGVAREIASDLRAVADVLDPAGVRP